MITPALLTVIIDKPTTFESSLIRVRLDDKIIDPLFYYYWFLSPQGRGSIRAIVSGTNVKGIRSSDLKNVLVPALSRDVQTRIASTLNAYDTLIENNRRRIQLLEESARLLYREWFVRLRFPGYDHVRIIGGVPEGWERTALESALVLQRGFDLPLQERTPGGIPIYGATGICGFHTTPKVVGPGVVTGRSGSLGDVYFVRQDFWPLNTALWVKEFRKASPLFAVHLLRSLNLKQFNGGVSVPTLDRKVAHRASVILPPKSLMDQFESIAADFYSQMEKLTTQIAKLTEARDLVLPKLMSGAVQV